jgi:hypothetical protein
MCSDLASWIWCSQRPGAYAAFGLTKPVAFIGAAHAQHDIGQTVSANTGVGDIEVISLADGIVEVPPREGYI